MTNRLPEISIQPKLPKGKSNQEKTRLAYEQFEQDNSSTSGLVKSGEAPIITLEFVEAAPKDFFNDLFKKSYEATRAITTAATQSNNATVISRAKLDPDNMEYRVSATNLILNEFRKYEAKNSSILEMKTVDKNILKGLIVNEIVGFGILEPLWKSKRVTEIMANGPFDIQIEEKGKIRRIPSLRFLDRNQQFDLISKIYTVIDRTISRTVPLDNARLHDNSRTFVAHDSVAPTGPNLNIRKHDAKYWSPIDIINQGSASVELMTFIGQLINSGITFLIIGGTGTGKTTLLNALTGFMPNDVRIVTLEKNIEMKPHPGKLFAAPMETVQTRPGSEGTGVTMRDLVNAATQMRPDKVIIGEVIDGSAYDLCQVCNTGHDGASSIHANGAREGISRLMSLVSQEGFVVGEAALKLISDAFDIVIVVDRYPDGSRKISEVAEVATQPTLDSANRLTIETHTLWEFVADDIDTSDENYRVTGDWLQYDDLSEERKIKNQLNLSKKLTWPELVELSSITEDDE